MVGKKETGKGKNSHPTPARGGISTRHALRHTILPHQQGFRDRSIHMLTSIEPSTRPFSLFSLSQNLPLPSVSQRKPRHDSEAAMEGRRPAVGRGGTSPQP